MLSDDEYTMIEAADWFEASTYGGVIDGELRL